MNCPNCSAQIQPDQPFCGSCGAQLPVAAAPTVEMPSVTPPADDAAAAQAAYQAQYAEYERQKAAWDAQQAAAQQAYAQAPYVPQPQPPKKKRTGLVIAIIVIAILLLGGCAAGVFFGYRAYKDNLDPGLETPAPATETPGSTDQTAPGDTAVETFPTALEAALSAGEPDWAYKVVRDETTTMTLWIGPPNSEWVTEVVVEQIADGRWAVANVNQLGQSDVPSGSGSVSEQEAAAAQVLTDFLTAIQKDDPDTAHALTVEPFALDSASAQIANGEFKSWEIVESEPQDDGSYWFHVTEQWYDDPAEDWAYYLVPTEAGYRISSLEPW